MGRNGRSELEDLGPALTHVKIHGSFVSTRDRKPHPSIDCLSSLSLDYFGADYRKPPTRMSKSECGALFDLANVIAAYTTSEMGIDPEALAEAIRSRLSAEPNVKCLLGAHVHGVALTAKGGTIDFEVAGARAQEGYDHVVNALWDDRLAVDKTAGIQSDRSWLYRLKYYLRVQAPNISSTLPSTTIVLGPFGDVVSYGNGHVYLSWYPAGMTAISSELSPPAWPMLDDAATNEMRNNILNGLRQVIPEVGCLSRDSANACMVKRGIICAWGKTDIHDPTSELHQRHAIGPHSYGRYHTVDTGKLTTAPLFAKRVADRVRGAS